MISPRLARLRKAAFVASPLCLPATATAPKGRNPYLLQPERKTVCSSWDRSFSSSSFPGRVYAGLGTAAAAAAEGGTALGGTVAVVSPALSRPSSANESAVRREGGVRGLQRPSPSAACHPLPFTAKWKAASGYTTGNHSVYPENDPSSELGNNGTIYYSSGGDMTSNSWESLQAGRPFWV